MIRQPYEPDDPIPFWGRNAGTEHHLYHRSEDPGESRNLAGDHRSGDFRDLLMDALREIEAPGDQLARLSLV